MSDKPTNPYPTIADLIELTQIHNENDAKTFHAHRLRAFEMAKAVYSDRAGSYNIDHEPTDELPYGIVSLVSEVFKRAIRMKALANPIRNQPMRNEDIARLADSFIDLMNYASWGYAMVRLAAGDSGISLPDPPKTELKRDDPASGLDDYSRGGDAPDPRGTYDPLSRTWSADREANKSAIQRSSNSA